MDVIKRIAFIDESGNSGMNLQKAGTSNHFVIAAILIPENKLFEIETAVEQICRRYFQTGEMKSSRVGKNTKRRMQVLQELIKLDFYALVGVTDKTRLFRGTGLEYHGSFIKFLSRQVHHSLQRIFSSLQLIIDEHGDSKFISGFERYIKSDIIQTLFESFDIEFRDSKACVLLQVADFIAGTVYQQYEHSQGVNSPNYIQVLMPKMTLLEWPGNYDQNLFDNPYVTRSTFDSCISSTAIRIARDYIEHHRFDNQLEVADRVIFLELLLCKLQFEKPSLYVSTSAILCHINAFRKEPCNKYYIRSSVVAPLRDAGLLIASNNQGYKIPVTEEELHEFFNHSLGVVEPMLDRLLKCRDGIQLATEGKLDLFQQDRYRKLRRLLFESE